MPQLNQMLRCLKRLADFVAGDVVCMGKQGAFLDQTDNPAAVTGVNSVS